jgi:hypothetical protein
MFAVPSVLRSQLVVPGSCPDNGVNDGDGAVGVADRVSDLGCLADAQALKLRSQVIVSRSSFRHRRSLWTKSFRASAALASASMGGYRRACSCGRQVDEAILQIILGRRNFGGRWHRNLRVEVRKSKIASRASIAVWKLGRRKPAVGCRMSAPPLNKPSTTTNPGPAYSPMILMTILFGRRPSHSP